MADQPYDNAKIAAIAKAAWYFLATLGRYTIHGTLIESDAKRYATYVGNRTLEALAEVDSAENE